MGAKLPNMGIPNSGLGEALFDRVQGRVLGLLFGQPHRSFSTSELLTLANSGTGAVYRVLGRLTAAGLITVEKVGNQKLYIASQDSPIFTELHSLILKTSGLTAPLTEALTRLRKKIRAAFVYGSIAKGHDTARSDIDLIVVAEALDYPDLFEALQPAERTLGRPIHAQILSPSEWKRKSISGSAFFRKVRGQPKLFVIGSENAIS